MTRRNSELEQVTDRSKVRVFYAEAEGSAQSIQDLLRALTSAMGRPVHVQALPKPPQHTGFDSPAAGAPQEPSTLTSEEETQKADGDGDDQTTGEDITAAPRRKRGEGVARDRNAGLTIIKSLNLRPPGKGSLKDFVSSKKPQSQMEQIAVYVYYLKRVLEESKLGFSHIFTCFKEVGERLPGDLPQTCRNAASQKGWIDTADQDDLMITTRGENLVEHELPRQKQSDENVTK